MEEESKTELVLNPAQEEKRMECFKVMSMTKEMQRYLYFAGGLPSGYSVRLIVEKEDRISVLDKSYRLRYGNNGAFLGSHRDKSGISYFKKGRSSARLKIWGGTSLHDAHNLMQDLVKKVNPSAQELLDNKVIREIATQGMISSIVSGSINDIKTAMQYYIRYSLRGMGINQDMWEGLYGFFLYEKRYNYAIHNKVLFLRTALNPNAILQEFHPLLGQAVNDRREKLAEHAAHSGFNRTCLAVGEKIDWADRNLVVDDEKKRIVRKAEGIKELLQMWEGGPVLKSESRSVNPIDNLAIDDGMPF